MEAIKLNSFVLSSVQTLFSCVFERSFQLLGRRKTLPTHIASMNEWSERINEIQLTSTSTYRTAAEILPKNIVYKKKLSLFFIPIHFTAEAAAAAAVTLLVLF